MPLAKRVDKSRQPLTNLDCFEIGKAVENVCGRIKLGQEKRLYLGNLEACRDWGYAPEYVEGMWRMLQADEPDDFVLATGLGISVREFLAISFEHAGLDWQKHVRFDDRYLRPPEVDALVGDRTKAETKLGWKPSVDARTLAGLMVDADIAALEHAGQPWIDQVRLESWGTA